MVFIFDHRLLGFIVEQILSFLGHGFQRLVWSHQFVHQGITYTVATCVNELLFTCLPFHEWMRQQLMLL
jgi:hypothetical protein